jgi:hypothetical protein
MASHLDKVFGFAWSLLLDREEALDAAQEVFVRLHAALPKFREESNLSAWLYRVCMNHCIDRKRRAKRAERTMTEEEWERLQGPVSSDPEWSVEQSEIADGHPFGGWHTSSKAAGSIRAPALQTAFGEGNSGSNGLLRGSREGPFIPCHGDTTSPAEGVHDSQVLGGEDMGGCKKIGRLIGSYAYGDLTAREMNLIRRHLERCPRCAEDFQETMRAVEIIPRDLPVMSEVEMTRVTWAVKGAVGERRKASTIIRRLSIAFGLAAAGISVIAVGASVAIRINSQPAMVQQVVPHESPRLPLWFEM